MTDSNDKEPWKSLIAEIWLRATFGRKWLAVTLIAFTVLVPGAFGLVNFYAASFSTVFSLIVPKSTTLTSEEENLRNEWVAAVAYYPSEPLARANLAQFKSLYEKYETETREGKDGSYAIWRDDILVARDPEKEGQWIIAMDMYYGPSNFPAVSSELARVARLGGSDSEAENTYQRMFVSSRAICYSQRTFEKNYGRIYPPPEQKRDHQGAPYEPCTPPGI